MRIEFPGAVHHVTSRSDRREPIYLDDQNRPSQLDILAQAMDRFYAEVLADCQMSSRFHVVLHTRQAKLPRRMRHLNGVYTSASQHAAVEIPRAQRSFPRNLQDCMKHWTCSGAGASVFSDSLIVAGAMAAGCRTLLSEDLQHGQSLDSLTVIDPFQ